MTAGYSGTPLIKKLSLKDGMRAWFHAMPECVRTEIGEVTLDERPAPEPGLQVAHIFTTDHAELERPLADLRTLIDPAGFLWVSWPKKASKVPTDITEDVIREICLPMGWVDVKVCAIHATWSGLKLMIRKELRRIR
ncbi:hypothetical protein [Sphingopyxis macrogoltabida]|uniref:DUF3052 domain-containing protein n=1 Tax=Sphingopyxis macrogoltabida TaxID=33050 RepID=A0A0N9V568_SPHMC|nr:hypothetical protein [Sphingopyxis macrogoltabida]ALH79098.1 hypothetical protein AN936_01525 [Sphingopyxis macrogoltabida]